MAWTSWRRLLRYAFTDPRGWIFLVGVTFLSSAFGLLQPWPLQILVDHVLGREPLTGPLEYVAGFVPGADTPRGMLFWVVLAGLAIFAINSGLDVLLTRAWIRVGQRMVYELAGDLFARAQRRSLIFHSQHPVGDLL